MRHAAYERGSTLVRRLITDDQRTSRHPAMDECVYLQNKYTVMTKSALAAETHAVELQTVVATLRERGFRRAAIITTLVSRLRRAKQNGRDDFRAIKNLKRQHKKTSHLLRMFTPSQIQQARADLDAYSRTEPAATTH